MALRLNHKTCIPAFLLMLLACHACLVAQNSDRQQVQVLVTTSDLDTEPAEFIDLDNEKQLLTFRTASNSHFIPVSEFVWWNGPTVRTTQPLVHLRDGSVVAGQIVSIEGSQLRLTPRLWQELNLPLEQIDFMELQIPSDPQSRQRQLDQMKQPSPQTRIWLTNGDVVSGKFPAKQDTGSSDGFPISVGNRTSEIAWSRIVAISFATNDEPKANESSEALLEICLIDGSCLRADEIRFDGNEIRATCGNLELHLSLRDSVQGIDSIQSSVCGIRNLTKDIDYLANRPPLRFEHQPLLGRKQTYQLNRSLTETPIRFGDTSFSFGIGIPSRSSTVFRIDQPSDDLWLTIGIAMDPSAGDEGTAECQVLKLNADNQWEPASRSVQIRGNDANPHFARLDVSNCRAIALTVDYHDGSDVLDRVNWIMPRIDKAPKQREQ